VVDPKSRSMTIANAGHLNPTLSKKNELKFLVTERGLPLGIKDYPYKENKILLNKDDKLYLYSDGVSEAMNAKREMFEDKRIIESLGKPNANYKTLYLDVKNFIGENPPNDDLTIVMIESL
jgi:sigma-B regulation protein RsbU (phosphoserine phosphatase)